MVIHPIVKGTEMSYQLYRRVDSAGTSPDAVLLGAYEDFVAALAARDADTVALFAATPTGVVMLVRHDIVGPGAHGPSTIHPVTTAAERRDVRELDAIDEMRDWLEHIHATAN
jgi:hypothetical protein